MAAKVFDPRTVDETLMKDCLEQRGVPLDKEIPMLPHGREGIVGKETRQLYFGLAVAPDGTFNAEPVLQGSSFEDGKKMPVTRIFSFGDCNVACPYCKRDCQFIDSEGNIIAAVDTLVTSLFGLAEGALARNEIVRFSGGDPVMFPKVTLAIATYLLERHGEKSSIAHNGSGTAWARRLAPFLSSAAIDLKATPEKMGTIMGIADGQGERFYKKSLETQKIITGAGAILDVRTPVFGNTSRAAMMRLGEDICENDPALTFWTWRMYKPVKGCDWLVPEKEGVFADLQAVSEAFPDHWMGIRAKWQKGGMLYYRGGEVVNDFEAQKISDQEKSGSGNFEVLS